LSLGIPADFDNEKYIKYLNKIHKKIPREKMAVHIPTNIQKQLNKYEGYGIRCFGIDTIGLIEYHKEIFKSA